MSAREQNQHGHVAGTEGRTAGCGRVSLRMDFSHFWGIHLEARDTYYCVFWIILDPWSFQGLSLHTKLQIISNMVHMDHLAAETLRWMGYNSIKAEGVNVCVRLYTSWLEGAWGDTWCFLEHSTHTWTLKPDNLSPACALHLSAWVNRHTLTLSNCLSVLSECLGLAQHLTDKNEPQAEFKSVKSDTVIYVLLNRSAATF